MVNFLTQDEVAERLRCSTSKIKRLRADGKLAYIPGRPVMIEEADFERYLESAKRQVQPPAPKKEKGAKPELEDVAVLARRIFLARQNSEIDRQNRGKVK